MRNYETDGCAFSDEGDGLGLLRDAARWLPQPIDLMLVNIEGYEYTLLWGFVCFAIALRGGGPYSVDRVIGREL